MSSPARPTELPPLGDLPRCPSQPAPPSYLRHVAPPLASSGPISALAEAAQSCHAAAASAAATEKARLAQHQQPLPDGARAVDFAAGGLMLPASMSSVSSHHELPPLRDPPMFPTIPSWGSSCLASSPASHRAAGLDIFYDPLSTDRGKGSTRATTESRMSYIHEIENLKRQVTKLTQLRQDHDCVIRDLLADKEASQRQHEMEMSRREKRGHRETTELVATQKSDQDHSMEEQAAHEQALRALHARIDDLRVQLAAHADALDSRLPKSAEMQGQTNRQDQNPRISSDEDLEYQPKFDHALKRLVKAADVAVTSACTQLGRVVAAGQRAVVDPIYSPRHRQEVSALRGKLRARTLLDIETRIVHIKDIVFRAWACDASCEKQLREKDVERAALQKDAWARAGALERRLRTQCQNIIRALVQRRLGVALIAWIGAVRDSRNEAAHRHRLLAAAADASAELSRLRSEARRTTQDLRKQRRAHGVAAIHASLDRRLQGVLHAWLAVARDAQRESSFQRQLDIAAAESAASCAVLRMEGRKSALELNLKRRAQALKTINADLRHCSHVVFYAWSTLAADAHQESLFLQEIELATAQASAACERATHYAAQLSKWQHVHIACVANRVCLEYVRTAFSFWQMVRKASVCSDV